MAATDLRRRESQRSVPVWLLVAAIALVTARIVSVQMARPAKEASDLIDWVPAVYARSRAVASRKLILYDFSAEWCGPCHLMDDEVFRNPRFARKINDRFIVVKVVDRQ